MKNPKIKCLFYTESGKCKHSEMGKGFLWLGKTCILHSDFPTDCNKRVKISSMTPWDNAGFMNLAEKARKKKIPVEKDQCSDSDESIEKPSPIMSGKVSNFSVNGTPCNQEEFFNTFIQAVQKGGLKGGLKNSEGQFKTF